MKKADKPQKQKRRVDECPTFNFNYEKVKEHCKSLKDVKEKLRYLNYVMKEKKNSDGIDIELHFPGPTFIEKIKNEIKYYEKELKLTDPYKAEGYDKIVWQKNRQDFAPLFNLLMQLGFISFRRNKWEMLCNHFTWNDGEMTPQQLKDALSNINHNPETHRVSDEISDIINALGKVKSS